jgi:hypothetical protein
VSEPPARALTVTELRTALDAANPEAPLMIQIRPADIEAGRRYAEAGLTVFHAFDVRVGLVVRLTLRARLQEEAPSS